jgi:hypothetical protein
LSRRRHLIIPLLVVAAIAPAACGSDEAGTGSEADVPAVAPPPDTAFDAVTTALEGQGLTVSTLSRSSLEGAESGIDISGDKSGTARLFASQQEADDYVKRAAKAGGETATVGTVVFQSGSQADAEFFADAYEG